MGVHKSVEFHADFFVYNGFKKCYEKSYEQKPLQKRCKKLNTQNLPRFLSITLLEGFYKLTLTNLKSKYMLNFLISL
jgi:hypothetical protein